MQLWLSFGLLVLSYLIGSIPFGLLIVRLKTGQDVRQIESGRTGGTNVMRAAGFGAGLATAALDILKSCSTVWLVRFLLPGQPWLEILAPFMAVVGHNHSIFLAERDERGKWRLRGGAGGASAAGGVFGLWWPSIFIMVPLGLILVFVIGYASVATMSVGIVAMLIFAYRAWIGASPWQYILYGALVEILLLWALRPNIRRLLNGTERAIGWRARKRNRTDKLNPIYSSDHSSSSSSSSS